MKRLKMFGPPMVLLFIMLGTVNAMPPFPGTEDSTTKRMKGIMAAASMRHSDLNIPSPSPFSEMFGTTPAAVRARGITPPEVHFQFLVVLVEFEDQLHQVDPEYFDSLIFGDYFGTVRDYYKDQSLGQLILTTQDLPSKIGWVMMPEDYSFYVNDNYGFGSYPHNSKKLIQDVINILDPVIDFSDYDNNGDGIVDGIALIHTGSGAELTGKSIDMWSHKWQIVPEVKDSVQIVYYNVQPEYWFKSGDMTIGVIAHEAGHLFGLPDLYDTDGSSAGLGIFALMASGSWNGRMGSLPSGFTGYCLQELGFIKPKLLSGNTETIRVKGREIYKVSATNRENIAQYYLITSRMDSPYDAKLPARGVVVTAIDEFKWSNAREWCPLKPSSEWPRVRIIQPDGLCELEFKQSYGDMGDMFPTNVKVSSQATIWPSGENTSFKIGETYWDGDSVVVMEIGACDCPNYLDYNGDGTLDFDDVMDLRDVAFRGKFGKQSPNCPYKTGDVDLNGVINVIDVVRLLRYVFDPVLYKHLIQIPCK